MTTTASATPPTTTPPTTGVARFNAWFFDRLDGFINRKFRKEKRRLLADVPAHVVDLGAGTGANLRYLPAGTQVTAIEPSVAMHDRLRQRAERLGCEVTIETAGAEAMPLPDDSVDMVISSLVLCTVPEPEQAMAEIQRVLRPGGRFVFIEHVVAPRRGLLRLVQRAVRRPWAWLFEGCDTCRDTTTVIESAGFDRVDLRRRRKFDPPFYPVMERISGTAYC